MWHNIIKKLGGLKRRYKLAGILVLGSFIAFWFCLPDPLFTESTSYVIEDREGQLLGATVASDGQWRFPAGDTVPEKFAQCIITYEDKRFHSHVGVDPVAMLRAVYKNITQRRVVSGGSTLSMQVIRLARRKKRNLFQKLIESVMALRLEVRYSKSEVLSLYAEHAPFGSNVVGLEAAAWRYYGRSPETLSWAESATLAVLPNAPSMIHPGKNRKRLLEKRNFLLEKLYREGTLSADELELALAEPLPDKPLPLPQDAPHLLQHFSVETNKSKKRNTRLKSTLHGELQREVSRIVERHQNQLKANGINNACALVMEIETGNVLAYVGNVYRPEMPEWQSHVDVIQAKRSPGSLLKPLLYASLMHDGTILPNSLVPDIPTQIGGYMPQNFDLGYDGAVPASEAISRSLNIPAVRMLRQYNHNRFYRQLEHMGITTLNQSPDHYGLSLILGGAEITLWDLAGAYASLVRAYAHQQKTKGAICLQDIHAPSYEQREANQTVDSSLSSISLDMASLWYMFSAMEDVMRPGEEGLWQLFGSSRRVAWKTGTSFGFRDGWALGFTPDYLVAVWTGNTGGEGRPGLVGVRTAAPILFDIFSVMPASRWFQQPSYGFQYVKVCKKSGFKAGVDCEESEEKMVPENGNRGLVCPYHQRISVDASEQFRVTDACVATAEMKHVPWFVLPAGMEWFYRQNHIDYKSLPPYKTGCEEGETAMEIIYPQNGSKITIPKDLDEREGETVFAAAHRRRHTKIYWHLDDTFIGETQDFHKMAIHPELGKHVLTLVDELGERESVWFVVE